MQRLAILIPCYNSADTLARLFEGINAQTKPFDEILCYDDASSDGTFEIAQNLGAKVIKGDKNRGAAYARNRLIENCNTEWIHFHDADDLIDKNFVEEFKLTIARLNDPNCCLISNMKIIDLNNKAYSEEVCYDDLNDTRDVTKYFLSKNGFAIIGCYPKKSLLNINGFREDIRGNEDPDLHIRLANSGVPFIAINKALVTNVISGNSFSSTNWIRCLADKLKCLDGYIHLLPNEYQCIIGQQAAELSNYFYKQGDLPLSKKAIVIAGRTNLKKLSSSKFASILSGLFGWRFYLWFYRRRVDFKLV